MTTKKRFKIVVDRAENDRWSIKIFDLVETMGNDPILLDMSCRPHQVDCVQQLVRLANSAVKKGK